MNKLKEIAREEILKTAKENGIDVDSMTEEDIKLITVHLISIVQHLNNEIDILNRRIDDKK